MSTSRVTEIRKLLVATDFSPHSEQAVEDAVMLARTFGAEIHLVHAFDVPVPVVTPYEVAVPTGFVEQARESARTRLAAVQEKVTASGVHAEAHLTEAPAAQAVARIAEEIDADLIVMGTRGNTGLKHVLLGSVAERTLRIAPCSVWTVKHPDDD